LLQIKIHPDFRLQGHSFKDRVNLLEFVNKQLPLDYEFLSDLFAESNILKVSTSGSTGKPKEIRLSKQAMLHSAEATGQFFDLPPKTTALHCLSSDYIAGKMMWVRAIHLGWQLEVVHPDSNPLAQTKANFDFAAMVPLQVHNSLSDLHRIQKLIIGGGAVSNSLEQKLKTITTRFFHTYGMTETITHIAVKKLVTNDKQYYTCLPNVSISTDNRDCLQINAPLLTNELIQTNDIVKLVSPTVFEWVGRFDNVINSGGVKLFPEQIEAKISTSIYVPFMVGALPDEKFGEKLILMIESKDALDSIDTNLAKADLSKYEYPKEIFFLPAFVRTKNGKLNRKAILRLLQ